MQRIKVSFANQFNLLEFIYIYIYTKLPRKIPFLKNSFKEKAFLNRFAYNLKRSPITTQSPPRSDLLVGLWGALSVLAYSALEDVSLLSGLRGKDRELPLLCKRLAEPQSRNECRLSRRPGIDRHLANRTLSLGFPVQNEDNQNYFLRV